MKSKEKILLPIISIALSFLWYGLLCKAGLCSLFLLPVEFMPENAEHVLNQFAWYNIPLFLVVTAMCIYAFLYTCRVWALGLQSSIAYSLIWPGVGVFVFIMLLATVEGGAHWMTDLAWLEALYILPLCLIMSAWWQLILGVGAVLGTLFVLNRNYGIVRPDRGNS